MDASSKVPAEGQIQGVPTHGGQYVQYNIFGNLFEVSAKYVPPLRPIGRGAYGIVCSAINSETSEEVAIKKIGNAFDNRIDAKRTLREIKLLRHIDHENVLLLTPLFLRGPMLALLFQVVTFIQHYCLFAFLGVFYCLLAGEFAYLCFFRRHVHISFEVFIPRCGQVVCLNFFYPRRCFCPTSYTLVCAMSMCFLFTTGLHLQIFDRT